MVAGNGWTVRYGSLLIVGCGEVPDPCPTLNGLTVIDGLNAPPDGVSGWGELRTSDVQYTGVDGSTFGRDYYDVRQVTMTLTIGPEPCTDCAGMPVNLQGVLEPRKAVRAMLKEWRRACENEPLIIYPPGCGTCTEDDPDGLRPVQVNGRPRVAQVQWQPVGDPVAEVTLRFDAEDPLMHLTDCCGTPDSGGQSVSLQPGLALKTRCYCSPDAGYRCYTHEAAAVTSTQTSVTVEGTECVCPTIVATGLLTNPRFVNLQTGGQVDWHGTVPAGSQLVIDPCAGTVKLAGTDVSRTLYMSGDLRVQPGQTSDWLMTSFGTLDTGTATVRWNPAVMSV